MDTTITTTTTTSSTTTPTSNDNNNNNNNEANKNKTNLPFLDFTGQQTELLKVQVIPSTEYALKGVKNELHVLFQLTTLGTTERTPCDLAIVLDRSGSMEGDKLENSKKAIKEVIQNLLPEDKLHLITYDSQIEVVFENADLTNMAALHQKINNIYSRGCTNLHGGLKQGNEVLERHKTGDGRVQRIFLFSDGLANEGPKEPAEIQKLVREIHDKGVSTSSFGIGADFDEVLMKSIAEHGAGDYFFIESAQVIPNFVDLALKGLLGLVGTDAVLKIRGANGAVVTKIWAHDDIVKGCHLGDIRQNNMRKIVCALDLSPTAGDELEVLTWSLNYTPDGQKEQIELQGTLKIKLTTDDANIKKNSAVEIARVTQEIAETDLEAIKLMDKGKKKEAIDLKKRELAKLREMEHLDQSGYITKLIANTAKGVEDMEKKSDENEVKKTMHYNSYKHARSDYYMM